MTGPAEGKTRKPYVVSKQRQTWSDEEHERFVEAIKLYTRDWKKIEAHVGTKTAVQIRSHAQKFFQKLERCGEGDSVPPPRSKRKARTDAPAKEANGAASSGLNGAASGASSKRQAGSQSTGATATTGATANTAGTAGTATTGGTTGTGRTHSLASAAATTVAPGLKEEATKSSSGGSVGDGSSLKGSLEGSLGPRRHARQHLSSGTKSSGASAAAPPHLPTPTSPLASSAAARAATGPEGTGSAAQPLMLQPSDAQPLLSAEQEQQQGQQLHHQQQQQQQHYQQQHYQQQPPQQQQSPHLQPLLQPQADVPLLPEAAPPLLAPPPEPPQEALLAAPVPVDGLQQQQLYQQHHQAMQLEAFGGAGPEHLSPVESQPLLLDPMSTGDAATQSVNGPSYGGYDFSQPSQFKQAAFLLQPESDAFAAGQAAFNQAHNPASSPTWQDFCDASNEWGFAEPPQYVAPMPLGASLPPLPPPMPQPLLQPQALQMQNLRLQQAPLPMQQQQQQAQSVQQSQQQQQPLQQQQHQQQMMAPMHPLRSHMGQFQQPTLQQQQQQQLQQLQQQQQDVLADAPGSPAEDISSMYTYLGNECDTSLDAVDDSVSPTEAGSATQQGTPGTAHPVASGATGSGHASNLIGAAAAGST